MMFIIVIIGLFVCPFGLFVCDNFTEGFTITVIGAIAWWMAIGAYKQEKEKKQAKVRKKSTYRKRNEDNFLNDYGYIDNSAFGSIQSFTHHDKSSK